MLLPGMRLGSLGQRVMTGGAAVMGLSVLIRRHQHKQQAGSQTLQALAVSAPVPPDTKTQLYSRLSEPYSYSMAAASASSGLLGMSLARGSSIVAFCLLTVALGCMAALPAVVSVSASALLATAVSRLLPEVASADKKAASQRVVDPAVLETVTGTWTKDFKHSSSMEPFFELFRVPSIVRRAAILIRGMSIVMDDDNLSVTMLCALPWFNVTEMYPLSGAPGQQKRRDMRRGKQLGVVETQADGSIRLSLKWDNPLAGSSSDVLTLTDGGQELHVLCMACVGEGRARYEAVYRRKAAHMHKGKAAAAGTLGGKSR